jgi:1-phosphofructokinase family hexose kinase
MALEAIERGKQEAGVRWSSMIITVTLNAAIDKSLSVPSFQLGRRHRTVEQRTMAGGKGVNIARTLKALGQPVIATGFAGGATGTHIVEQLTEESILNDFVRIREESRTNTSVLDPTDGQQTEINERGPAVSEHEIELFRDKLLYLARGAAIVVFAGSLPRAVAPDFYASLIRDLQRTDVTTVIDTDGEPLLLAARAEPDVVSPNVLEAEELVGHEFAGEQERSLAVREMAALGPREAIMTLPDGCFAQVLVDGQPRLKRARVEPREPIAKRGSGDAFLAGYVAARYEGRAADQCLRFGVACGAESTGRLGAGLIDPREARRLMGEVELSDVELPAQKVQTTF